MHRACNDVVGAFQELQLALAPEKIKCTAETNGTCENMQELRGEGKFVEMVTELVVLGSKVCAGAEERKTFEHRIAAGWGCYKKSDPHRHLDISSLSQHCTVASTWLASQGCCSNPATSLPNSSQVTR